MRSYEIRIAFLILIFIPAGGLMAQPYDELKFSVTPAYFDSAINIVPVTPEIKLVQYKNAVAIVQGDEKKELVSVTLSDRVFFSRSGLYFAIGRRNILSAFQGELALYHYTGSALWTAKDVAVDQVLISDDGRTVVSAAGFSIFNDKTLIQFFNEQGKLVNSIPDIPFVSSQVRLSPDGSVFVIPVSGDRDDGIVTLDDKLILMDREGQILSEIVATGLHFTGEISTNSERIYASFYADSGREQYIKVLDLNGNEIRQIESKVPNYGAYKLHFSPDGEFLAGFGHHHILVINSISAEIIWEWEWKDAGEDVFIADCIPDNEGNFTYALAYASKSGRIIKVLDKSGRVVKENSYQVNPVQWDKLEIISDFLNFIILDNGSYNHQVF